LSESNGGLVSDINDRYKQQVQSVATVYYYKPKSHVLQLTRVTQCFMPMLLYTKMGAQCNKLGLTLGMNKVDNHYKQRSINHDSPEFEM